MASKKGSPKPEPTQTLQVLQKKADEHKPRDYRRVRMRMARFLKAYEDTCGNISAACEQSGVSRRSYYRWVNGRLPIYQRFQHKLFRMKPKELLQDLAHGVVVHHMKTKQNLMAAMFTINTLLAQDAKNDDEKHLELVGLAFKDWREDNAELPLSVHQEWCRAFAERGGISPKALARQVGLRLEEE